MLSDEASDADSNAGKDEEGKKKKEGKHKQLEVCEIQTREIVCTGVPEYQ